MAIKSYLLNDDEFLKVRESIETISAIDNEEAFRVKMVEYVNDSSDNNDDKFFFDMVPYIRFLNPSDKSVAYTTPEGLIYMNAPQSPIKNLRQWDFIYDHECLHQLWDTFGVKEKLIQNGVEYNHTLLNIASDCVINDYLAFMRKKEMPDDLITPQLLKSKFNVSYDRKTDTQYTLYIKLLSVKDEVMNDSEVQNIAGKIDPKEVRQHTGPTPPPPPNIKHSPDYIQGWKDAIQDVVDKKVDPLKNRPIKNTGNNEYDRGYNDCMSQIEEGMKKGIDINTGGGGGPIGGSDLPSIPWNIPPQNDGDDPNHDSDDSDNSNDSDNSDDDNNGKSLGDYDSSTAQKDAADAEAAASAAEKTGDKDAAEKRKAASEAKDAADRAQKAHEDAKAAKKAGDKEGERKAKAEEKRAAAEAHDAANRAKGNVNKGNTAAHPGRNNKGHITGVDSEEDLERIKKEVKDILEKHAKRVAGVFGDFCNKCRASKGLKKEGIPVPVIKGSRGWVDKLEQRVNAYIRQQVWLKKRQFKQTYSRIKRGSGFINWGDPLKPGKRVKKEAMVINIAFYLDRSGSMGDSGVNNAFDATYRICEIVKKKFGRDKVVEDVIFKIFAWDDSVTEIKYGRKTSCGGSTMPMENMLDNIIGLSNDFMINVILTDGDFDISQSKVDNFIKDINGIVIYIINNDSKIEQVKKVAQKHSTQIFAIQASPDFTFN